MPYLLLVLLLSQNLSLLAQEIAPFQLEDTSNLVVDQEILQQITGKVWVMYERRMYVRERCSISKHAYQFSFHSDGVYEQINQMPSKGEWEILNDQLINFKGLEDNSKRSYEVDHPFSPGGYALMRLTAEVMILSKNLTSNFDNKVVLFFVVKEKYRHPARPRVAEKTNEPSELEWYNMYAEEWSKEEIIAKLKAHFFMRKMKFPVDLASKSKEEVQQIYLDFLKKKKG